MMKQLPKIRKNIIENPKRSEDIQLLNNLDKMKEDEQQITKFKTLKYLLSQYSSLTTKTLYPDNF